ncbi:MAG: histidinol-phosphatase HisJ family protein [Verrucomicrobia bacterium]|nr:histidinol-phosphatase HisJ family protein [Verrucomicrobiota bacterium]
MNWPPDYHMHTPLCRHATGSPSEYARSAREGGLGEIGFSDHSPMERDGFDDWRMRLDQLDEYVESVRRAQRDHPELRIRLGLELDYIPGHEAWLRDLAGRHPWDYLIGSVHYVDEGWAVDNPAMIGEWSRRAPSEIWAAYFDRLTQAAEFGGFDCLGHADLPKKFGHQPHGDCSPLHRRLIETARRRGLAIEINTGGLRKECREIYPGPAFLALAFEAGVPITFGSDAHAPSDVGAGFKEALAAARAAGYRHCLRFEGRRREAAPLEA